MLQFLYKFSFKKRIWISFIALISLSITVIGTTSYFIAANVVERNATKQSQNTLNKSAQVFNEQLRQIVVSTMTFMFSDPFKDMLTDVSSNRMDSYYQLLSSLQIPFSQLKINELSIESILISTPIGEFYSTMNNRKMQIRFDETDLFPLIKPGTQLSWAGVHEDQLFTGNTKVITLMVHPLLPNTTAITEEMFNNIYIIVNIKADAMDTLITKDLLGTQEQLILLSKEGKPILSLDQQKIGLLDHLVPSDLLKERKSGNYHYTYKGEKYLVNYTNIGLTDGWILYGVQSKSELLREVDYIKWLTLIIMVCCILIALLVTTKLSNLLTKPLTKLERLMNRVETDNDLSVRFASPYEDEVTRVGLKFNKMLIQIGSLVEEVKAAEREKRKSNIKALQAQIDPHFLYNTLNTILWKSETGQSEDVNEMIVSLSLLFQLGLNKGNEITTLEKELEHVRQYVLLQQKCYEDLFDFHIELSDETLLQLPILKLLLQPLVENAIKHGFNQTNSGGMISITIDCDERDLVIYVKDNGSGMNTAAVYESLNQENNKKSGYALWNVYHRLRLYYGTESGIELHSEPNVQTVVILRLPIIGSQSE